MKKTVWCCRHRVKETSSVIDLNRLINPIHHPVSEFKLLIAADYFHSSSLRQSTLSSFIARPLHGVCVRERDWYSIDKCTSTFTLYCWKCKEEILTLGLMSWSRQRHSLRHNHWSSICAARRPLLVSWTILLLSFPSPFLSLHPSPALLHRISFLTWQKKNRPPLERFRKKRSQCLQRNQSKNKNDGKTIDNSLLRRVKSMKKKVSLSQMSWTTRSVGCPVMCDITKLQRGHCACEENEML